MDSRQIPEIPQEEPQESHRDKSLLWVSVAAFTVSLSLIYFLARTVISGFRIRYANFPWEIASTVNHHAIVLIMASVIVLIVSVGSFVSCRRQYRENRGKENRALGGLTLSGISIFISLAVALASIFIINLSGDFLDKGKKHGEEREQYWQEKHRRDSLTTHPADDIIEIKPSDESTISH